MALLTMIPTIVPLIQNTGLNIITAQNKLKFRNIVYAIVAVINVISTYIAILYWGIIGAAFCSCIAFVIGPVISMNIYYKKVIGIDIVRFWKNIISMSLAPILMTIVGFYMSFNIGIETIEKFLLGVIGYSVLYMIIMWKYGMNEYEKNIFLQPITTVYKKVLRLT